MPMGEAHNAVVAGNQQISGLPSMFRASSQDGQGNPWDETQTLRVAATEDTGPVSVYTVAGSWLRSLWFLEKLLQEMLCSPSPAGTPSPMPLRKCTGPEPLASPAPERTHGAEPRGHMAQNQGPA